MDILHDPAVHASLRARVQALRPDATRKWGRMTPDQMLRHLNIALSGALGLVPHPAMRMPLPGPLFRFFAYWFPMPRGAPTHPDYVVGERFDFEAEKAQCVDLLDTFTRKPMNSAWPSSPIFGRVTGKFSSRVQAKHVDHHLRQFGA